MPSRGLVNASFSKNLTKARKLRGLKQEELAARAGVHQSYISKYEGGLLCPYIDTLCTIAKVLDVSADYLIGLSDDPATMPPSAVDRKIVQHLQRLSDIDRSRIIRIIEVFAAPPPKPCDPLEAVKKENSTSATLPV